MGVVANGSTSFCVLTLLGVISGTLDVFSDILTECFSGVLGVLVAVFFWAGALTESADKPFVLAETVDSVAVIVVLEALVSEVLVLALMLTDAVWQPLNSTVFRKTVSQNTRCFSCLDPMINFVGWAALTGKREAEDSLPCFVFVRVYFGAVVIDNIAWLLPAACCCSCPRTVVHSRVRVGFSICCHYLSVYA